jgi:adenosylcobinamide hydrolase
MARDIERDTERHPEVGRHACDGRELPVLVWRWATPMLAISSATVGGGSGPRSWIVNAQVPHAYSRTDVDAHVDAIARANGCRGAGVGMLTAAPVNSVRAASEGRVRAWATVGLGLVTWAADADDHALSWAPGTSNVVALLPVRLTDAALVNAVITATEAKTQALAECGVPGTGTASDAVCIACPATGSAEPFGGPRSPVGAPLARVVHAAVTRGIPRSNG